VTLRPGYFPSRQARLRLSHLLMHTLPRFVLIAGVLLTIIPITGCGKKSTAKAFAAAEQVQPVEVTNVSRRDLVESLSLVGSLAANESAQLRAEIAGQVRAVQFQEGDHVTKDQVLVRIDDAELRAQVAQAEAAFHLAELNLKRSANLTEAKSMSQAEADRILSEHASAEAALSLLRVRLAKTEIKAPFDGVVGARTVSPGDYITAATVITTLDDLSRMKIEFQVPERFLAKVGSGARFVVSSRSDTSGNGQTTQIPGEVYFVSSSIDRATRSSQVKGFLTDVPRELRPGMFANVSLTLSVKQNALTVPEGAILTTPRGTQVIAVRDEQGQKVADFVSVKLGLRSKGLVEIEPAGAALADGQPIVASGVGALILFPGAKLEPRPQKEQFRIGGGE
jgi:membrane fusion protein (multidrug efflux system)